MSKRKNQCLVQGCDFDKDSGFNKCVLHRNNIDLRDIPKFYRTLEEYIAIKYASHKCSYEQIISYFKKTRDEYSDSLVVNHLTNKITFDNIRFPSEISGPFFYLLSKFGNIVFDFCSFRFRIIPEYQNDYFFYSCTFYNDIAEFAFPIRETHYDSCLFKNNYTYNAGTRNLRQSKDPEFNSCAFNELVTLKGLNTDKTLFTQCEIKQISIESSVLDSLPLFFTSKVILLNSTIKSSCTLSANTINLLDIIGSNIQGLLSVESENIYNFNLKGTTLNSVSFNNCNFTSFPHFSNVTVTGASSIQRTKFFDGLCLKSVTFLNDVSFLDTVINDQFQNNTSRETYRIIKHSFDSIGNTIEANKYFALEMRKAYEELSWKKVKDIPDKFLMWFNKITSDYGQKWWLTVIWILGSALLIHLFSSIDPFNFEVLNGMASVIIPYKEIIGESHQMSKLLTFAWFSILLYQLIVALKRKTRR